MSDNQTGPQTIEDTLDAKFSEPDAPTEKPEEIKKPEEAEAGADADAGETDGDGPQGEDAGETDADDQVLDVAEYGDVKVTLADGTVKSLSELASGNLMQSDYTRKTQELARQRQEIDAERDRVAAEIAERQREIDDRMSQINEDEPNWIEIARDDPLGYPEIREQWNIRKSQAKAAQDRLAQQQQEDRQVFARQTSEIALQKIPEWADPDVFQKGGDQRRKAAIDAGFTDAELEQATDYRLAVLLEKAARYDALQGQKKHVLDKKVSKAPRVLKPGSMKTPKDATNEKQAALNRKLSRPHSIEDALAARGL